MKADLYERMLAARAGRRGVMKGAAALAAATAFSSSLVGRAMAAAQPLSDDDKALRREILAVPGVGKGQPTDADLQKVGELVLGATKKNIAPGEFKGVELTFMGLDEQSRHNGLYRGLLKAWEDYTGAEFSWIDLTEADYNTHLQQSIATGSVDFDVVEMGAPFEGDVCGTGLTSEMPDWVGAQIDMDDVVACLQPPVGTWNGKQYRVPVGGNVHTFNYRTDVFADPDLAKAWDVYGGDRKGLSKWGAPVTWQQVQVVTRFLKGQKFKGTDVYGYLDAPRPWGGYGFYFLASRAAAYAKYPGDRAFLFDENMTPLVNNPAWVRAIQDIIDALPDEPPDQINVDPHTAGFGQFLAGTGSMIAWWGELGAEVKTNTASRIAATCGFSILPGSDDVYNRKTGMWETLPSGPNYAPNCAHLGWGIYVTQRVDSDSRKQKAAWSAAAHLGGKDLSIWTAMYPSGLQPCRNSQFDIPEWIAAGYDETFVTSYLKSESDSYSHPNAAIEPRIPGIFRYYGAAEDILADIFAGKMKAQQGADAIAAAWDRLTDQIGRDSQIKAYKMSLGL